MKKVIRVIFLTLVGLFLVYVSLLSLTSQSTIDNSLNLATLIATPANLVTFGPTVDINDFPFQDNASLYKNDDPGSVVVLYVTVQSSGVVGSSDFTWGEINDFTNWTFQDSVNTYVPPRLDAIAQFGNESGPLLGEVGYGVVLPNATIQLRAISASPVTQQSYKIELQKSTGLWRGQSALVLNKHVSDLSRSRQKLNFDLMEQIPNLVSMRTQFVHLYVKDETNDPPDTAFIDYGLYTQIEQPNKRFLENHLLDRDGQFYKAVLFEFQRYPDQIRLTTDPLYDDAAFSTVLEIKGNLNHEKLIRMLDDVNNYSVPIEQTFGKYFNSDNYFTWMAYNILVGNISTSNTNFFLYSPKNAEKWYFIPWDYDASFPLRSLGGSGSFQTASWQIGVSNYWGVVFHNRVLRVDEFRHSLDDKINQLLLFLTPDRIANLLNTYRPATDLYVSRLPDLYYLPGSLDEYNQLYQHLPDDIHENYQLYLESLQRPMPFNLMVPEANADNLILKWGESYDFNSEDISYHVQVSSSWAFDNVIYDETVVNQTSLSTAVLAPGEYFWKVTATNSSGKTELPFDSYVDVDGLVHEGMKQFVITLDGQVLEP